MSNVLELTAVTCSRGDRVLLTDVSFSLRAGQALRLVGGNGAGKTTLMRVIAGLAVPDSGVVSWNGQSIDGLREEYSRELLFFGHAAALKDELTATENLIFASELTGRHLTKDEALEALGKIGLRGREGLFVRSLSAGQRRRVNLARLLLPNPAALWVLDEPFTALDVVAVKELAAILGRHLEAGGMLIYTTHQEVELTGGAGRQLMIGRGQATIC